RIDPARVVTYGEALRLAGRGRTAQRRLGSDVGARWGARGRPSLSGRAPAPSTPPQAPSSAGCLERILRRPVIDDDGVRSTWSDRVRCRRHPTDSAVPSLVREEVVHGARRAVNLASGPAVDRTAPPR